jgi:hypothetical protein
LFDIFVGCWFAFSLLSTRRKKKCRSLGWVVTIDIADTTITFAAAPAGTSLA